MNDAIRIVAGTDASDASAVRRLLDDHWRNRDISNAIMKRIAFDERFAVSALPCLRKVDSDAYMGAAQVAWLNGLLDEAPLDAGIVSTELEHGWRNRELRRSGRAPAIDWQQLLRDEGAGWV